MILKRGEDPPRSFPLFLLSHPTHPGGGGDLIINKNPVDYLKMYGILDIAYLAKEAIC